MHSLSSKMFAALLVSGALLAPAACKRNEVSVARDPAISDAGSAAREARRASDDLRASRAELARAAAERAADGGFVARRDNVVGRARTSLAAMDQKIAELETYRKAGDVVDPARADGALARLGDQRRLAAAALDDLSVANAGSWDTRRIHTETAFADLDDVYKDARATMNVRTATR